MSTSKQKQRRSESDAPNLSAVEWMAVAIFLDWQIAVAQAEYESAKQAVRIDRNAQTVAKRVWAESRLQALKTASAQASQVYEARAKSGKLPPFALCPTSVIERN